MSDSFAVVDAFASGPFTGNPAAVCVLERPASAEWMQSVATEFNLPMTAFVVNGDTAASDLRWFTPTTEVGLCGHATLAAAHVLARNVDFSTAAGVLACRRLADGTIEMDFPAIEVHSHRDATSVVAAMDVSADDVVHAYEGDHWHVVELREASAISDLAPDKDKILGLAAAVLAVAFPADEKTETDSVCRVFNPAAGLDEDAVTGSAHCIIAPLLGARTGRSAFTGHQASRRGGRVGMRVAGNRVFLRGAAHTVAEGRLVISDGARAR